MSEAVNKEPSGTSDDMQRRLEALRKKADVPTPVASDLPNIPAQKLIYVMSLINARQVNTQQNVARNHQELVELVTAVLERTSTIEAIMPATHSQDTALGALHEQVTIVRRQHEELSFRLVVVAITLGFMILSLGAVVALFAGGQR